MPRETGAMAIELKGWTIEFIIKGRSLDRDISA
jgi:hypothetical protein